MVVGRFPWATLVVNLAGCLGIGLLYGALGPRPGAESTTRLLVGVGFLGGFTTFSAYGWQTFTLLRDDEVGLAVAYVAVSTAVGLALVWLGWRLTR